jgi:hypothetical protein
MALRGFTVAQIVKELPNTLSEIAKKQRWKSWKAPSKRTIQRIVRKAKPPDPSGTWTLDDFSPEEARVVLDFLGEAIFETEGRIDHLTRAEAQRILRLRSVAPTLDFLSTVRLANEYFSRQDRGVHTKDLDGFVAFAPWRSQYSAAAYFLAVLKNWIPPAPQWLIKNFPASQWFGFEVVATLPPDSYQVSHGFLSGLAILSQEEIPAEAAQDHFVSVLQRTMAAFNEAAGDSEDLGVVQRKEANDEPQE